MLDKERHYSTYDVAPNRLLDLYPDVESVILFIAIEEADEQAEPNYQQIIFTGHSVAAFRLECSRDDCVGGGFDFSSFIDELVRSGKLMAKGKIACQGSLKSDETGLCCALNSEYRIVIRRNL